MAEGTWVGLDVHARSVVAGVLDAGSGELRSQRAPTVIDETVAWLQQLPAPVRVAYEAGPTGYGLARACAQAGIACTVAAASKIPRAAADRVNRQDQPAAVRARADQSCRRLHARWQALERRGKRRTIVAVAVARELSAHCWALATM